MTTKYNILKSIMFIMLGILIPANSFAKDKPFTVIIDAGHGGKDFGAIDNGTNEKEINLGVALKLGELIKKNLKNTKVIFTRSDDTFKTLQERADIANKAKGDLFISIHTNSIDKTNKNRTSVAGSSVYALGLHKDSNNMSVARRENSVIELENDHDTKYQGFDANKDESYIIFEMAQKKNLSKSIRFANDVQQQMVKVANRRDRGVHQAGFWVLWATSMPAVLIELDFICNPVSAEYLASTEGQQKLAEAIFNAVKAYEKKENTISDVGPSPQQLQREVEYEQKRLAMKETQKSSKTNNRNNNIDRANESEIIEETINPVLLSTATPSPQRITDKQQSTTINTNTKRRRRSEKARSISEAREIETSSIPLHYDDERIASHPQIKTEKTDTKSESISKPKKNKVRNENKIKRMNSKESKKRTKVQHLKKIYCIQLLVSKEQLKVDDPLFKNIKPISMIHENNLYKYTFGQNEDRGVVEVLHRKIKKDFPDSTIIETLRP